MGVGTRGPLVGIATRWVSQRPSQALRRDRCHDTGGVVWPGIVSGRHDAVGIATW